MKLKEFEKVLDEHAAVLAEAIVGDQYDEKEILSKDLRKKKIQNEITTQAKNAEKKVEEGLKICIDSLDRCAQLPMAKDLVVKELKKCFESISSEKGLIKMGEAALSNISYKTFLKISDPCMQSLYLGAKALFDEKNYQDAIQAFFVLCFFDPTVFVYWVGFGHSNYNQKYYEPAINGYSMASSLRPSDSSPHIWAANCFEEIKNFENAEIALDEALSLEKSKDKRDAKTTDYIKNRLQTVKMKKHK